MLLAIIAGCAKSVAIAPPVPPTVAPCEGIAAQGYTLTSGPEVRVSAATKVASNSLGDYRLEYRVADGPSLELPTEVVARACPTPDQARDQPLSPLSETTRCWAEGKLALGEAGAFAWTLYASHSWRTDDPSGGCGQHRAMGGGCDPIEGAMMTVTETSATLIVGRAIGGELMPEHTVALGRVEAPRATSVYDPPISELVHVALGSEAGAASLVSLAYFTPTAAEMCTFVVP